MNRFLVALAVAALPFLFAAPAGAGGATWEFNEDGYQPGDIVRARTGISWEHNPDLGTPDDGPYYVYVVSSPYLGPWDKIPATAIRVGTIATQLEPIEEHPGWVVGPHGASVDFVLPNLEPGWYELWHCNDPCTNTLADITWGVFAVLFPDGSVPTSTATPPDTIPPPTTIAPTTTTTGTPLPVATPVAARRAPTDDTDPPVGLFAVGVAAVVSIAVFAGFRGRERRGRSLAGSR